MGYRLQNIPVTRAEVPTAWALAISFALHVALLATIALFGSKALKQSSKWIETRDVWAGDTVIVTDLMRSSAVAAQSEPAAIATSQPAPKEAPSRPAALQSPKQSDDNFMRLEDQIDPDAHPVRKKEPAKKPTAEDALAAKILGYEPHPAHSEPEQEAAVAPIASSVGAAGPAGPPRQLARAFTRAIPAANNGDSIWDELPLGDAGSIVVDLTVDDAGALSEPHVHKEPARPPRYLERLVDHTLVALKGGRFVLSGASTGTQTLRIDVTVSSRAVGNGPLELGFEAPRPGRPGRGYFELPSGRFVEAKVTIE